MLKLMNRILVLALCFSMMSSSIYAKDNYEETQQPILEQMSEVVEIQQTVLDDVDEAEETGEYNGLLNYIDVDYDTSGFTVQGGIDANYATLPSSYSLKSSMPAVRNQNPYGSCWAHAAIASAESSAINQGIATTSVDLSELALAYFFYNRKNGDEPLGLTNGDFTTNIGKNFMEIGGNSLFTTFALAGRMGYTYESNLPYSYAANVLSNSYTVSRALAYKSNAYVIDDIKWANMSDKDTVKEIIRSYGAVAVSYYHLDQYYNSSTKAYYNNSNTSTNHAITIVGWNDNYSRNNFSIKPSSNGAWLVRNSWGSSWGDGGYFWISYEDTSIKNGNAFQFHVSTCDSSEYLYQYDGSNGLSSKKSNGSIRGANIYTAKRDEVLDKVGFFTNETNVGYTISIYKNATNGPQSGELVSTTSGTVTYAGYHTVNLGRAVELPSGTKFSIVVTLRAAVSSNSVSMMIDTSYTNGNWIQFTSSSSAKQSYYATATGSWQDLSQSGNCNVRIKGYTKPIYNVNSSNVLTAYNGLGVVVNIPSNVVEIQSKSSGSTGVFASRGIISASFPSSLKTIGDYAFYNDNLSTLTVPTNVTYIGHGAFSYNSLSSISLNSNIKTIGHYAFSYNNLKDVYLPKSLTTIGTGAFYENNNAFFYVHDGSYAHTWAKSNASGKYYVLPSNFTGSIIPVESIRMNESRLSLSINQTKKLTVYYSPTNATVCNTVTWSSANPNIATVDANGNVKLLAEGSTTIYATTPNGLVASCLVEYGFGATTIQSITRASSSSLKLTWNRIPNAKGYVIYRSTDNVKFTKVGTVTKGTTVTWTNTKLSSNKNYYYYVVPYTTVNGKTVYADQSNVYRGILLSTPTLTVKNKSYQSNELSWTKVSNATFYEIYRSTSEKGTYNFMLATPNTSYLDEGLTTNQTYYYKVVARSFDSYGDIKGAYSSIKSAKVVLSSTKFKTIEGYSTGKVVLEWNEVEGATKYEVYRSTSSTKNFTKVYDGDLKDYVDTVTKGTVYYYKVRPVREVNGTTYTGSYSSVSSVVCLDTVNMNVVRASDTALNVSWNKVAGASGYVVYRASDGYNYTAVKTITKGTTTSWKNEKLKNGNHYWYYVRAYKTVGKTKIYSAPSNIMETAPLKTPSISVKCSSYQSNMISWNAIAGANYYQIYRSISQNGEYSLVQTTSSTSWEDTGLTTNQTYYYKVRAATDVAIGMFVGAFSSVKSVKTVLTPSAFTSKDANGAGQINLKWKFVDGAVYYQVVRSTSSKGEFDEVYMGSKTSFTDVVDLGVTYYYKVRPIRIANGQYYYGEYSGVYSATTIMQPEIQVKSVNYDAVDVSWNAVNNASGYEVYRSTSTSGKYSLVATVDGSQTNAVDSKLTTGKAYYYKVRAYVNTENGRKYSPYSAVVKGTPIPNTPVIMLKPGSTSITISWDAVPGASSYEIYRATSENGKYTKVTTVSSKTTSYTNTKLSAKTKYYYKVRVYRTVSKKKYYSEYSVITSEYPNPAVVSGVSVTPVNEHELKVSWKAVTDATAYEIMRTNDFGLYDYLCTVPSGTLSYNDTNLMFYKEYGYKVFAIRENEGIPYYSSESSTVKNRSNVVVPKTVGVDRVLMNALSFEFEDQIQADGYEISMKKGSKGKYSVIFDNFKYALSSYAYNNVTYYYTYEDNLSFNTTYYYRVRAFKYASDGTKVYSAYSTEKSMTTTPVVNIGGKYPKTLYFKNGGYMKATGATFTVSNINTYSNTCDLKMRINYSKVSAPNSKNRVSINFYNYEGAYDTWWIDYSFSKKSLGKGYADCTFYDVPLSYIEYNFSKDTSATYSAEVLKDFDISIVNENTVFEVQGYGK